MVTLAVPAAIAPQSLSSDAATTVVKEMTRLVRENYVFADKVDGIVATIDKHLADGRYACPTRNSLRPASQRTCRR